MLDTCPPSPALSAGESLDDGDLDALLTGLGELSKYGTPLLEKDATITMQVTEVLEDEFEDEDSDDIEYRRLALHFADETSDCPTTHTAHATLIRDVLWHAELPAELLALAHNILRRYSLLLPPPLTPSTSALPADLLVVATLALAVDYTHDCPPRSAWWSRDVCRDRHTARRIDQAILHVLLTLDWALHGLATPLAVERGMDHLFPRPQALDVIEEMPVRVVVPLSEKAPLKLVIRDGAACWVEGQLTPADTPLPSPLDVPQAYFLRLL
ncbi:hypothetical protein LTR53_003224 [Teratosphaeriaceae sp. CCFEE 6253]|nr:hypothetical protein LTR53_003224 [Teratosphaeriaceae sp. CCFEE 6253]